MGCLKWWMSFEWIAYECGELVVFTSDIVKRCFLWVSKMKYLLEQFGNTSDEVVSPLSLFISGNNNEEVNIRQWFLQYLMHSLAYFKLIDCELACCRYFLLWWMLTKHFHLRLHRFIYRLLVKLHGTPIMSTTNPAMDIPLILFSRLNMKLCFLCVSLIFSTV